MTICFFGNYIPDYPRIAVLKKGLHHLGIEVIECHTRKSGIAKFIDLYHQHQKVKKAYDYVLVGMGAYTLTWFAKLLSSKPVIFDAFVSLYITNVEDRKSAKPKSLKAKYYRFLDKFGCKFADKVLLDTKEQIDYFVKNYKLPKQKFARILVGSDDGIFYPTAHNLKPKTPFIVHWHGHIVPFHGVEIILQAAEKLKKYEQIRFQFVTRFTSKYKNLKRLSERLAISNISFYPETSYTGLARYINNSDVCLGVFSQNPKGQVVVPNKIVEAAACKKAIITTKTKAVLEIFSEDSLELIEPEDPEALAEAILRLYNNSSQRKVLSQKAYRVYKNKLTPEAIAKSFLEAVNQI